MDKWIVPVAVVVLVAAGWVDREIRTHWETSEEIQQAVDALEVLPATVGDWVGEPVSLDEIVVEIAACAGYKSYRYIDQRTGHSVDVTVMVGIPGQMAEHTPETCYPAAGYTLDRRSWQRVPVSNFLGDSVPGELARMDFLHPDNPRPVRVWHGWYDGQQWSRPEHPRLAFVTRPMLCRLQASATLTPDILGDSQTLIDPSGDFLKEFLPVLTEALEKRNE